MGGAVAYAANVFLFIAATKLTTAANAVLLQRSAPIFVALFGAWFFKERASRSDWITICAVVSGMLVFFFDDLHMGGMLGNICAIFSGAMVAAYSIFLRQQKETSPLESVILGNLLVTLASVPFIFESPFTPSNLLHVLLLGTVGFGIPFVLYCRAITYVPALEAVLLTTLEPVLNPVWVFLVYSELPGQWAMIGGTIVLMTVTIRGIWTARSLPSQTSSYQE
jgi:drug/metabolite transporter (DMT)-like permease